MRYTGAAILTTLLLSSCAQIDAVPLDAKSYQEDSSKAHGIRYYIPKPYLLVMSLPAAPETIADSENGSGGSEDVSGTDEARSRSGSLAPGKKSGPSGKAGASGAGGKSRSGSGAKTGTASANTPAQSSSDTSFTASSAQYVVKLIYLPDFSQPMALKVSSGLFGTASISPTLQDGWMLTSLNGQADSGGSQVLQTVQGLISTLAGTAGKGAVSALRNGSLAPSKANGSIADSTLLPPGLYEFDAGTLKPVVYFCSNGPQKTGCSSTNGNGAIDTGPASYSKGTPDGQNSAPPQ